MKSPVDSNKDEYMGVDFAHSQDPSILPPVDSKGAAIDEILVKFLRQRNTYMNRHLLRETDEQHLEIDLEHAQEEAKQAILAILAQEVELARLRGYEKAVIDMKNNDDRKAGLV